MPGKIQTSRSNFLIVTALLGAWALLVIARLVQLQVVQHESFSRQARRQQERTIEVSPVRGVIYDRNYHPLAMSVEVDSIFAVPGEVPSPESTARVLAPILHLPAAELERRLQAGRFFSWVKRKVSGREAARVRQLNLQGIYFQKENKRFYPKRDLAAHVLGYVGMDDKGLAGIELAYEKTIRGRPGELLVETDAKQHWLGRAGRQPEPGDNVNLTIDENIQYIAERELAVAVDQFRPVSASVIVQDPNTGEILAMANQPTYNPNTYAEATPDALRNLAVSASYEPGSTFKIVTVASALEEKLAEPDERIDCQMGSIVLAGHVIHDHKKYGMLSVNEIIQNSSDVGAIKLALRLGDENMYRYMRSFGFGAPTGIELPGEARGLTKPPERWSKISIGAIAMGQEVGVTPLQLTTVASAAANGGWWMRPHLVRDPSKGLQPGGDRRRIMSEETAAAMRKMLAMVVTSGTATTAQLNGYTAAGKTGTAQKIDPRTRTYSRHDYVASFVGFAPVEAPRFTILVVVDSPRGKIYGGDVAAPVFKRIAEQILAYRNVSPSLPTKPSILRASFQPALQRSMPRPQQDLDDSQPEIAADERSDSSLDANSAAMLSIEPATAADFVGKTVRAVAERAQAEGIAVKLIGSGIAYQQSPSPGSPLAEGQKVNVWFRVGGTAGLVPPEPLRTRGPHPPSASQPAANRLPPQTPQQTKWLEPAAGAPQPAPGNPPSRPVQAVPVARTG